jgi:hypothetical protein
MIPQSLKDALDRLARALGRKSVDALIAKIPFQLTQHIARVYYPDARKDKSP